MIWNRLRQMRRTAFASFGAQHTESTAHFAIGVARLQGNAGIAVKGDFAVSGNLLEGEAAAPITASMMELETLNVKTVNAENIVAGSASEATTLWKGFMPPVTTIASIVSICMVGFVAWRLLIVLSCEQPSICGPQHLGFWTKSIYLAWTVGVPTYFFAEWIFGINWAEAKKSQNKAELDRLKALQDQARAVWAGFAATLGAFLLKYGG